MVRLVRKLNTSPDVVLVWGLVVTIGTISVVVVVVVVAVDVAIAVLVTNSLALCLPRAGNWDELKT